MAAVGHWYSIPCRLTELRLDITLACGQSFRWNEVQKGVWRSVLAGNIWTLRQTDKEILFQVQEPSSVAVKLETDSETVISAKSKPNKNKQNSSTSCLKTGKVTEFKEIMNIEVDVESRIHTSFLQDYLQLDVNLDKLYKQWREVDANFNQVAADFPGVRILRQDPTENLFAFICSSNNNISRITSMVEKLCTNYGDKLGTVDGEDWYTFPTATALAGEEVEQRLRELGFGYRAKFINQSAKCIAAKEVGWLKSLRSVSYEKAHSELLQLTGVGAKVADCVCLMSLDKTGAIPVDTHVWQIAARDYIPKLAKTKSLTDRIYKEIGDHFRGLFGEYAGWAHSVLFSADLKKFKKENTSIIKGELPKKHTSSGAGDLGSSKPKKQRKTSKQAKK